MNKLKFILSLCIALAIIIQVNGQVPSIDWNYRQLDKKDSLPHAIRVEENGNLIVASGKRGIKVYNSQGVLLRVHAMGATWVKRVLKCRNRGYFAIGDHLDASPEFDDGWVAKLDDTFGIVWQRNYGGFYVDRFFDASLTEDDGLIIGGMTASHDGDLTNINMDNTGYRYYCWVVKVGSAGNIQWTKVYGNTPSDPNYNDVQGIYKITPLKNGDYLFGARVTGGAGDAPQVSGIIAYWIVRADQQGTILWQKTYGGNVVNVLKSGVITPEGNFVATGVIQTLNGVPHASINGKFRGIWALKVSAADGTVLWSKAVGASAENDVCNVLTGDHVIITRDSNIAIGGCLLAPLAQLNVPPMGQDLIGQEDYWILKLSGADGTLLWHKVTGGNRIDRCNALASAPDGGIIAAGNSISTSGDVNNPPDSIVPFIYAPWFVKLNPCPYLFDSRDTICFGDSYPFYGDIYDSTGIYTRTFKTTYGCDSTYRLNLVVIGSKPELIQNAGKLSTGNYQAYQWLKNGAVIPGADSSSLVLTDSGSYQVIVVSGEGCTDTSDAFLYLPPGEDDEFQLYPNPTTESLFLRWGKMKNGATIVIYDAIGRIVFKKTITANKVEIPVASMARAAYLLKVITVEDEKEVRKFIRR